MTETNCNDCWNTYNKLSKCKECRKEVCYKCLIVDRCKSCYVELENDESKIQNINSATAYINGNTKLHYGK